MARTRLILWAVAMWATPALVGGIAGWPGIWGGGTAFGDLILPAPITGGILHVPSFVLAILLVCAYPKMPATTASVVRAALIGASLIGLARLVDLDRIVLSFSSDLSLRGIPWQQDYLRLCLMTDSLWALSQTLSRPRLTTHALAAAAIAILLPAGYLFTTISSIESEADSFVIGRSFDGPKAGDENQVMYTTLDVADSEFRPAARAAADRLLTLPERNGIVEDMAIYFTDSLEAAKSYKLDRVLATLCVYEDGTRDRWLDGYGDCFSDHVTFSERFAAAFDEELRLIPLDLQAYLAARAVCADVVLPTERDKRYLAEYRCYDLDTELEYLRRNYSDGKFSELLPAAP